MKMNSTFKQILLAFTILLSVAACKKDKKDPDPAPPTEVKAITLTDLKALSTGASVKVPDAKKITGVVISDVSNKNIDSKTVVLQDAATQTGIIISFDAAQTFAVGDQLEVNVSNQTLAQVNGEVVLQNVPAANAKKTGTGTITGKTTTTAEIATNKMAWDGTLVTLSEGSFTGGNNDGKFSGTLTYTDAKGDIKSNVIAGATFAGTPYPAVVTAITGIVRINGTDISLDIRKATDVTASTIITRTITDDFSTLLLTGLGYATTPVGVWDMTTPTQQMRYPADDFLQAGTQYFYVSKRSNNLGSIGGNQNSNPLFDYRNLKTISMTFAGSKYTGDIIFSDRPANTYYVYPFDPAQNTTEVTLSIYSTITHESYILGKATFSDVGMFHTVNFKFPEPTVEAYAAAFKQLNPESDNNEGLAEQVIAQFTATPDPTNYISPGLYFTLAFTSSSRGDDPSKKEAMLHVIQKVVLGLSK